MRTEGKILHLFGWDKKFVLPFIDFVGEYFDRGEHRFIVHGGAQVDDMPQDNGIIHYPSLLKSALPVMAEIRAARKVILHGLFSSHLLYLLMLQPWLLKKCYWTIWGGDLYIHQTDAQDWRHIKNEWCRRFVISRLGHFVTHIHGDYELARKWYGARGQWHECFMYPSNLYREYPITPKPHEGINILLGNSATPSNNHLDALEKLRPFADENIRIYCPLSYGDAAYGDQIATAGRVIFGEKFIPLHDFMPFDKYLELLAVIDIAVFNHNRQQGMGNITTLLGLGKKVFIRNTITTWGALQGLGVDIFDAKKIDIQPLSPISVIKNQELVKNYFSPEALLKKLKFLEGKF